MWVFVFYFTNWPGNISGVGQLGRNNEAILQTILMSPLHVLYLGKVVHLLNRLSVPDAETCLMEGVQRGSSCISTISNIGWRWRHSSREWTGQGWSASIWLLIETEALVTSQHKETGLRFFTAKSLLIDRLQKRLSTLVWEQQQGCRCSLPLCPDAANTMDTHRHWGWVSGNPCYSSCSWSHFPASTVRVMAKSISISTVILGTHFKK